MEITPRSMLHRLLPLAAVALGCAATTHAAASGSASSAGPDACAGLSAEARGPSPFAKPASIVAVHPLVGKWQSANRKVSFTRVVGASIVVRAEPGMTAPFLERVATCVAAQYAMLSNTPTWDPLVPPGARVRVLEVDGGFAVQITSDDPDVAKEIVRRANEAKARS